MISLKKYSSVLLLLSITATNSLATAVYDPLESFNRSMFSFNKTVLEYVVEPSVAFLQPILPNAVINAAGNVYSNFTEIEFVLNGILVGDPQAIAASTGRFMVNSTIGIGGLFDVAGYFGLERVERDFVESVCKTGLPPGPYIVFPLIGPANLYSAAALAGGVATEVYLLSFISTTLAVADFVLIDIGGTASSLRYMRELPLNTDADSYAIQRTEHLAYVNKACGITTVSDAESATEGGNTPKGNNASNDQTVNTPHDAQAK